MMVQDAASARDTEAQTYVESGHSAFSAVKIQYNGAMVVTCWHFAQEKTEIEYVRAVRNWCQSFRELQKWEKVLHEKKM